MARLIFAVADVRRVVEHSLAAPNQMEQTVDFDLSTEKTITRPVEAPAIILVHDEGVYLMSNGQPADPLNSAEAKGEHFRRFCAYAKDCNPVTDADCWDNARALVGGDDFAEVLPWAQDIKTALDAGAKHIVINFGRSKVSFTATRR